MSAPGHHKVDPDGRWVPFAGWSVIFDRLDGQWLDDRSRPMDDTTPAPVSALDSHLRSLDDPALAVLPAATYHITVCDGVNPSALAGKTSPDHALIGLGHGAPAGLRAALRRLIAVGDQPVDFSSVGVEVRNNALVLALEPTDASRLVTDEIIHRRDQLMAELGRLLGTDVTSRWRPHITLAYRRSPTDQVLTTTLHELEARLGAFAPTVRVDGIGVYQFDSMVAFRRVSEAEMGW